MNNNSKLLSVISHVACLFTSAILAIAVPVILLSIAEDEVSKGNAREAINFQITMFIWAIIGVILAFVGIGFVILFVVAAWSIIAPIIKIIQVLNTPDQTARYGFIFRFVK